MDIYTQQTTPAIEQLQRSRRAEQKRAWSIDLLLLAAYGLALLAYALMTPLQVPEIEAVGWSVHFNWNDFWYWSAQSNDPSPIGNLIQLPFVHFLGVSRLITRIPGIVLAAGSGFLFLKLVKRAVPKRRYTALLLFVTLPLQLMILTSTVQYEAATFFSLLATIAFFRVTEKPGFKTALVLAFTTGLALFTDHHSGLPIAGAVLFLLRFSPRAQERRALWFGLAGCVWAAAPYIPYYIWSTEQTSPHWLTESAIGISTFPELTPIQAVLAGAIGILVLGAVIGGYASFRLAHAHIGRRLTLFCLLGSVLLTIVLLTVPNFYFVYSINPRDLMFAAPQTILLFMAAVHWALREGKFAVVRFAVMAVMAVVIAAFLAMDLEIITAPKNDFALQSQYVAPELQGDSCVVFASEFFSRQLFFLEQPRLQARECQEFFHHRIVLASHPYVTPEQQTSSETFFEGLNFAPVKRIHSGGGTIIVFDNK